MVSGRDWYQEFYQSYFKFPRIRRVLRGGEVKDAEWTKIMKDEFLTSLAQRIGYQVGQETVRVDQVWKRNGKPEVAIEHENWFSGIWRELTNLSVVDAKLRVLITYVEDGALTWRPFRLADEVRRSLEDNKVEGEFLLLVTDEQSNSWVCFLFEPKFKIDFQALPPPKSQLKSWDTIRAKKNEYTP